MNNYGEPSFISRLSITESERKTCWSNRQTLAESWVLARSRNERMGRLGFGPTRDNRHEGICGCDAESSFASVRRGIGAERAGGHEDAENVAGYRS